MINPTPPTHSPRSAVKPAQILVVDDEEPFRSMLASMLRMSGYEILEADCGQQALEILSQNGTTPGLLITDLRMPGIDGFALLEEARDKLPKMRVMAMSGMLGEPGVEERLGRLNVRHTLEKPFCRELLLERVQMVLAESVEAPSSRLDLAAV